MNNTLKSMPVINENFRHTFGWLNEREDNRPEVITDGL